jgi:hypothetical protein
MTRAVGIASALAVAVLVLVGCGGGGSGATSSSSSGRQAEVVRFEAARGGGPNPFTPSADTQGSRTVELAETSSNHVCNRNNLMRFLAADSGRMIVWASVLHVPPSIGAVRRYIAKLHPVTLSRDTLVTDHGFTDDQGSVPFQAILQAGSAVLVDRFGRPVVRCVSGNPLGPPEVASASRCIDCPAHYSSPPQCQFARGADYDARWYRRAYYSNQAYDQVFVRLQPGGRFGGCYQAYPKPPPVTIVALYKPPAKPRAPSGGNPTQQKAGLNCKAPRSQLEFEQCSGVNNGSGTQPTTPKSSQPSQPSQPQRPSNPSPPSGNQTPGNLPQVGECNNGVDDNGNGLVDTADPGCSGPNDPSE